MGARSALVARWECGVRGVIHFPLDEPQPSRAESDLLTPPRVQEEVQESQPCPGVAGTEAGAFGCWGWPVALCSRHLSCHRQPREDHSLLGFLGAFSSFSAGAGERRVEKCLRWQVPAANASRGLVGGCLTWKVTSAAERLVERCLALSSLACRRRNVRCRPPGPARTVARRARRVAPEFLTGLKYQLILIAWPQLGWQHKRRLRGRSLRVARPGTCLTCGCASMFPPPQASFPFPCTEPLKKRYLPTA